MNFFKSLIPKQIKNIYRIILSLTGSIIHGNPSKHFKIIAVTGTSGKTTTSFLLYHILNHTGFKAGIISTVAAQIGDKSLDTGLHITTPDPFQLQKMLAFMRDNDAEYVIIETSSHALAQNRLGLLNFDYSIITNIKSDHLDWHKTWTNYANAKANIIKKSYANAPTIFNSEDEKVKKFLLEKIKQYNTKAIPFEKKEAKVPQNSINGITFMYQNQNFKIPIFGEYNINNVLAAIKLAETLEISPKKVQKALKTFKTPKGRMDVIQKAPFYVIVDFAHNQDSFEKSLTSARKLINDNSKLITVFGSAGLRDKKKRRTMGETAGQLADITIVTAEDPRTESLFDINTAIAKGAQQHGAEIIQRFANTKQYHNFLDNTFDDHHSPHNNSSNDNEIKNSKTEDNTKTNVKNTILSQLPDKSIFLFDEEAPSSRYDAIDLAVQLACKGDLVITQGKGHEQSLCFGKTEYPFSDHEAVQKALTRLHNHNMYTSSR